MSDYNIEDIEDIRQLVSTYPDNMYIEEDISSNRIYRMFNWITGGDHTCKSHKYCIIHDYLEKETYQDNICKDNLDTELHLMRCIKNGIFTLECCCDTNRCYDRVISYKDIHSNNYCKVVLGLCSLSTTLIGGIYLWIQPKTRSTITTFF